MQIYLAGMKGGEIQYAITALYVSVGFSFFGGSHLNLLSETATDSLGLIAKHNYETLGAAGEMFDIDLQMLSQICRSQSPSLSIQLLVLL